MNTVVPTVIALEFSRYHYSILRSVAITVGLILSLCTEGLEQRKCQSLPSSPVLLRKAAEKLHQESLHGSARYCHQHQQPQNLYAVRARSKSTVFSDAFAHHLRAELALPRQLGSESLTSTHIPETHLETEVSSHIAEFHLETESCSVCEASTFNHNNGENAVSGQTWPRRVNGCPRRGHGNNSPSPSFAPSTATRRRMMRKLKYQSLDGDIVGVPPIQPLPSNGCVQSDATNRRTPQNPGHSSDGDGPNSFSSTDRSVDCNGRDGSAGMTQNGGRTQRQGSNQQAKDTQSAKTVNNNLRKRDAGLFGQHEISATSVQSSCESCMHANNQRVLPPSSVSSDSEGSD